MTLYPSIGSLLGCLMTAICWGLFARIGLNTVLIRKHIFSWLIFLSMSMYRILPLFATLLEGKPIDNGFQMPIGTFVGETFLYMLSCFAFYMSIRPQNKQSSLVSFWNKFGFYDEYSSSSIWIIGLIGFTVKIYLLLNRVFMGDAFGKAMEAIEYFQYAPLILLFPSLYKRNSCELFKGSVTVYIYLALLMLLSLSTNQRYNLLAPIGTIGCLFLLSYIKEKYEGNKVYINRKMVVVSIIGVIFIVPFVSDISVAMLANRSQRDDLSKVELLKSTWETYTDENKMNMLRKVKLNNMEIEVDYDEGWTEAYLDNFAFNRYCNIRITDITMYYAEKIGYCNERMLNDLGEQILSLLPTPVLSFFNHKIDKVGKASRGDMLYKEATGSQYYYGLRVTSHLGDGLATFGYFYFIIQFFLFYLEFRLVDTFIRINNNSISYSICGLISIFSYMSLFRNSSGCFNEISYILRGYWQSIIIFLIMMKLFSVFIKKSLTNHD